MRTPRSRGSIAPPALAAAIDAYLPAATRAARSFGHDYVGTEHLLLALCEDERSAEARALARLGVDAHGVRRGILALVGPCADPRQRPIDADALALLGVDLDEVRARVEAAFGRGALDRREAGHLRLTARARRALERAAKRAQARPPTPADVLLAVIGLEDTLAARLLAERGVTRAALADELGRAAPDST